MNDDKQREPDRVTGDHESERSEGAPETSSEPAPGVEHEPEPDAENIVPAKDQPGTL